MSDCRDGGTWRGASLQVITERGAGGNAGLRYLVAVDSLPADLRAKLAEEADEEQILGEIERLKTATAMNRAQDAGRYVPRRDYEVAVGQLNELRGRERERHDEEIVRTVDSVIAVGDPSFPPARRNEYLAMCREEGGLKRFREIMVPDPARSLSRTETAGRTAPRLGRFNAEEEAIFETMGVDPSKVRE